jgi:hypothetical protein
VEIDEKRSSRSPAAASRAKRGSASKALARDAYSSTEEEPRQPTSKGASAAATRGRKSEPARSPKTGRAAATSAEEAAEPAEEPSAVLLPFPSKRRLSRSPTSEAPPQAIKRGRGRPRKDVEEVRPRKAVEEVAPAARSPARSGQTQEQVQEPPRPTRYPAIVARQAASGAATQAPAVSQAAIPVPSVPVLKSPGRTIVPYSAPARGTFTTHAASRTVTPADVKATLHRLSRLTGRTPNVCWHAIYM